MSEVVMLEHGGKVVPEVRWSQVIKGFVCDGPYIELSLVTDWQPLE